MSPRHPPKAAWPPSQLGWSCQQAVSGSACDSRPFLLCAKTAVALGHTRQWICQAQEVACKRQKCYEYKIRQWPHRVFNRSIPAKPILFAIKVSLLTYGTHVSSKFTKYVIFCIVFDHALQYACTCQLISWMMGLVGLLVYLQCLSYSGFLMIAKWINE